MRDAIIAGQTDYIYGFGALWVENSTLVSRSCSYVTAMKGLNTTFPNKYGAYISNSRLISNNATVLNGTGKCSLGRPWNSNHRSVFMNTYLDPQILPAGYTEWSGAVNGNIGVNTTMAVYNVYGPGNNVTAQQASNLTKIFTAAEVAPYSSPVKVFMTPQGEQPNVAWIDPLAYL
jgi:pectin methylesterase-like acyl-CoA thioesterase